jgi:hypothetical protein
MLALGAAAVEGCGSNGGTSASPPPGTDTPDATADGTAMAGDDGATGDGATGGDDTGAFDAGPACDPDAQADVDCTGRCGPVRDACGHTAMCGGCPLAADGGPGPLVCDLGSGTCTTPKITCTALGAQCGTVRDTCGDYLDCPDTNPKGCAAGKECNSDTHQCQACESVSCADLGYECGFAWLGCGPNTQTNFTDCGSCAKGADGGARVCNPVFNLCEPACKPATAAVLCAAAMTASGVQCGFISNGCGGIVDCDTVKGFGCATGQSCGVRGIANHCDPQETPDECVAQGRQCGQITSACTGLKVTCGSCATGQSCNANGLCGAPCTPKTCADFATLACGTFDDTCGGKVTCGTCPGGVCNQTSNTCCAVKQCTADYAGKCGTSLPDGCGGSTVTCGCSAGTCTTNGGATSAPAKGATGKCCVPTAYAQGQCGTNLPDGCGGKVSPGCQANQECVGNTTGAPGAPPAAGVVGSCCTRTDSCNLASGTCGPVQDSCRPAGTTYDCNQCTAGMQCVNAACCNGAPACAGNGGEGAECNDTKQPVDTGCGSARTCACAGGRVCWCTDHVCGASDGAGACTTPLSCSSAQYANQCGVGLSDGTGGTLACNCPTGQVCTASTPGALGTCQCNNPTNAPYTCANVPGGPGQPGGDACGTYDNGCGGTLPCNCPSGQACNTTPNPNVCCKPATCPTAALGSACGNVTNGCTTVKCGCPSGTGNENFTCTASVCACVKDTCRGRTGAQPDRCGGTLQCGG